MNIEAVIARCASVSTGKPLLIEANGKSQTTNEFAARVKQLSKGLANLGLKEGAVVGLLALNSIAYSETICGTICAGMVIAPLNLRWSLAELDYAVTDANIETIIVEKMFLDMAVKLREKNPLIRHIILIESETIADILSYEDLFKEPATLNMGRDPKTPCLISYTGGTTGFPKGVVHSHASILGSALNMAAASIPTKGSVYLIGVPMFHVSGFAFLFSRLIQLDTMVIVPMFRPDLVAKAVREYKVEDIGLVPTMLQMTMTDPGFNIDDFASLKRIFYGASPISQALLKQVMETFKTVELTQLYGMTEVGVIMNLDFRFHHGPLARPTACGQPLALTNVIIEDENGKECAVGEIGELVHYGASVMLHYHNKPEENAKTFRNGGMRSGDAGYKDEMGVITLSDRLKDMIISGGENVYSTEAENAIASHPDVLQVAVIGKPHEKFLEAVHAVIVPKPGKSPSYKDIRKHAEASISGYKLPRSIELIDAMPLSPMNKILKSVLRDEYLKRTGAK